MTTREAWVVKWGAAVICLGLALGFWVPAFHPPESAQGPRCEWYEAGNRMHFAQQMVLGCIPLVLYATGFFVLRRRRRLRSRREDSGQ